MLKRVRRGVLRRLADRYKARKQRTARLTREHALAVGREMLERTKYCFLISQGADGWCSTRLVEPIVDEDDEFVLWFGTDRGLRKVREIEADPRVTVAVENRKEHANLVLYGTARIERDPAVRRHRWRGAWRMFFPGGPAGDDYVVIRFEAERVELMNFARDVIPEPFGLRPLVLERREGGWKLAESSGAEHRGDDPVTGSIPPATGARGRE